MKMSNQVSLALALFSLLALFLLFLLLEFLEFGILLLSVI